MNNSSVKVPPNAVESLWYNDFLIYTVQDPYQYVAPPKEPTYTAHAWRPQDNRQFRVGGPTENRFYPHRSRVVLLWAVKQAFEAPPLPVLTIPLPDYDGFKLTVARVPNIGEQLFVGKAEKGSLVIEDQHAESDRLVINLRLKIDRYTYLEKEARDLSSTMKMRGYETLEARVKELSNEAPNLPDTDAGKVISQRISDLLSENKVLKTDSTLVKDATDKLVYVASETAKFRSMEKDLEKFEERSKDREKKTQLRDEKGRYSKGESQKTVYEFKYDANSVIDEEGAILLEVKRDENVDDAAERGNW